MADVSRPPALDHIEVLAAEAAALIAAIREGPLDVPVAACPGWDLTALAGHVGKTWRWSTVIVRERLTARLKPDPEPALLPENAADWLEEGIVDLLDVLRSCPADAPVWGFGPPPRTVAFWNLRQAMETVVHRVDAELARDELAPVQAQVAADGVGEFVDVMLPRLYGDNPPSGRLVLNATDTAQQWALGDPAAGTGTLSGRAEDLLLALWNRRSVENLAAGGDPDVLAGWRALGAP